MIIDNDKTLRLMGELADNWFRYLSPYQLVSMITENKDSITAPTVYSGISRLESLKCIMRSEDRKKVKLDFRSNIAYNFKILRDTLKVNELNNSKKEEIIWSMLGSFQLKYGKSLNTFIVFGSAAELSLTKESDVDILMIVEKEIKEDLSAFYDSKVHIIIKTQQEIEKDYMINDDFIISILANNLLLYDDGYFRQKFLIRDSLPLISGRTVLIREDKIKKEKEVLKMLLDSSDTIDLSAWFEKHIINEARLILLKNDKIPGSKQNVLNEIKKLSTQLYKLYKMNNPKNVKRLIRENV